MKLLYRYLILLCLMLLGAYGHSYAYMHQRNAGNSFQHKPHTGVCISLNNLSLVYKSLPSGPEKQDDKIVTTDEEEKEDDDEQSSFRIISDIGKYLTTFFYLNASEESDTSINHLLFSEHYSYFSSSRYIMLRVIRV